MRQHMSSADRAKQFMPFAALKGYDEAIRLHERCTMQKTILGEDAQAELDEKLRRLHKGCRVSVVHYCDMEYMDSTGTISKLDTDRRFIVLDKLRINIDDILDVSFPGE